MNFDPRLVRLGVTVEPADYTQPHWRLQAAWLTVSGSWDDVPAFARPYQRDYLGGDHHVFGMARDLLGYTLPGAGFVLVWPDGAAQRTPADSDRVDWADCPIYAGYDWAQMAGPYAFGKFGNADKLCGVGLPFPPLPWQPQGDAYAEGGVHVSVFDVWQECEPETEPPPPPPQSWRCRLAGWLRAWAERLCPMFVEGEVTVGGPWDDDNWDDDWDDWPTVYDYLRAFKEMATADTLVEMDWHDATGLKVEALDMR